MASSQQFDGGIPMHTAGKILQSGDTRPLPHSALTFCQICPDPKHRSGCRDPQLAGIGSSAASDVTG